MLESVAYESYGARLQIRSNDPEILRDADQCAQQALIGHLKPITSGPFDIVIDLIRDGSLYRMERNGEYMSSGPVEERSMKFLDGIIRISVGEYAKDLVILHAGAVAWQGKGLIFPADSFRGKSSLVSELVRAGAEYYSDDFAIIDRKGGLHPFPRPISMRTRDGRHDPYEVNPQDLRATVGRRAVPVRMVFFTEYRRHARWLPTVLSSGEGILKAITYTLPLRRDPDLCLKVLNTVAARAIMAKSHRGDARRTARFLLDFLDSVEK
ncbi:MAG: hypothetical protein JO314_00040 [Acidobacteria bacterium]|nr:hypothetical protein [Acidobacteriota bacterium]